MTLWNIADQLRGSMNADDFRDYRPAFLFPRYLSDNYESSAKKQIDPDYLWSRITETTQGLTQFSTSTPSTCGS